MLSSLVALKSIIFGLFKIFCTYSIAKIDFLNYRKDDKELSQIFPVYYGVESFNILLLLGKRLKAFLETEKKMFI